MSTIVPCPVKGCTGFVGAVMAEAFRSAPNIFDDDFHTHLAHHADHLDGLLEIHNHQRLFLFEMWHQYTLLLSGVDPERVLKNLGKLIDAAIMLP